jgi:hypothetical protein
VAQTAELRAGNLVLELFIPVLVRISAVVTVGTNQMGIVRPGIASCFTRNSGTPKLWMTSLLLSLTMIGLFTGR